MRQLLKNVLGSSEITARALPVAASTSITRIAWWPRWVYPKATVRLSCRHVSRDITYGFGNSSLGTISCLAGWTWKTARLIEIDGIARLDVELLEQPGLHLIGG